MTNPFKFLLTHAITAIFLLSATYSNAAHADGRPTQIDANNRALISVLDPAGWTAGAQLRFEDRSFSGGPVTDPDAPAPSTNVDLRSLTAHFGFSPIGFVRPWVEAGVAETEGDLGDANPGFIWGLGARAKLFELALEGNRTLPRKATISLDVDVSLESAESEVEGTDLSWEEFSIAPRFVYQKDHRGDAQRFDKLPDGTTGYIGLRFSDVDVEYAQTDYQEEENLGLVLGTTLRVSEGFAADLNATFYGSDDRSLRIGFNWHF